MSEDLQELLATKRRLWHQFKMKEAMAGLYCDPSITIQREDIEKEIRAIEQQLGRTPTPTMREIRAQPVLPRYVAPEPEPVFRERMVGKQMSARQADIEHQMNLLNIHRRNLGHLRAQMKELGAFAPPYVRNGVQEAMKEIASRKSILRDMGQDVQDLPGDE